MTDATAAEARQPSEAPRANPPKQPLLSVEALELASAVGEPVLGSATMTLDGRSLVCVGRASALLQAAVDPALAVRGTLLLWGETPAKLLASGTVGYCPRTLPAPGDFTVFEALLGSVRLIGLGASDVRRALDRAEAEGLAKRRLKDLGALEQRLVGLAHGLASDPALLLLEDPCSELEDDAAELALSVVERELEDRSWILGTELRSPWSRRLALRAALAVTAEGGTLLGPVPPTDLASPGSWACFDQVTDALLQALSARGAEIVRAPSENVVLLRGLGGLAIMDVASAQGSCLLELVPLTPGD